ncbi:CoA transferase [Mycolicibacterium obuense]|uniref:CoA transferase n=1 Tax=Mycolicibacterium obuense TaxID=1807 RepID=A0A0M2JVG5_9MYCO|nr:CoA transferase [Mycolicibacterium obuense]KKE98598.1 acyl-CoA transferase [Mycolicibacterium obuense]TDL07353.1 CoA transferase [Mycolicibacterium obuense]
MGEARLLTSVRVLDLSSVAGDGAGAGVGRILADLGADVLQVEPPGGSAARTAVPTIAGAGIGFALDNANKRATSLNPAAASDRNRLQELAAGADIVIDSGNPGGAALFGTSTLDLADRFDHLVVLSVTDFGLTGPRASWRGNDAVFYALSSALSRTGPTTGTPVLPPVGVGSATATVQAAWAVLAAYYDRTRSGRGDFIDFSRFEAVLQALDPPYGSEGQAAVGLKPPTALWRGRPRNQQIYPIFGCRDGHVRICLLSPRQWRGMRAWLGEPARFAGPEFDTIAARYAASAELNEAIAAVFATQSMDELVARGRELGVPIAAVRTPGEALRAEHFRCTGALVEAPLIPGATVTVPVGPVTLEGEHLGFRSPAPGSAGDDAEWLHPGASGTPTMPPTLPPPEYPFAGLRILDLGVIVAGGELGRLFADLGAEVIKIESAAYPDGLRQAPAGMKLSRSWALTHRNEYSLGLDLRDPGGAQIFADLVATADAVFANFKPGTLAALGFSIERLREINPDIVLAESSAYGDHGPWSDQMGYGPLVRASTGITRLWRSPDAPTGQFFDATTIFPDHVVGRLTAVAAVAALIRRDRSGTGAHLHLSQAEVAINQLADRYVIESARAAGLPVVDDDTVHAVCPCAGDDEWCVISLPGSDERATVATLMAQDLPQERTAMIAALGAWTSGRDKVDVAELLQHHGVPAAPMNRAADVPTDPQVLHRNVFGESVHPLLERPIPAETAPAPYRRIPRAPLRPAPMPGEHTREICTRVLGLTSERIDALLDAGVLFDYHQEG